MGLFLDNIDKYKQKIGEIIKDEEIIILQTKDEENKLEESLKEKNLLKTELENLILEIENIQNIGFESSSKIEKCRSDISIANEKITNNKESFDRYLKEIEEVEIKIKELEEEKVLRLDKKTKMFANLERFTNELKQKEEEFNSLNLKLSDEELKIESKKQELENLENEKLEKKSDVNLLNANYEHLNKQETDLKDEVQNNISELDASRISKEEISKIFYKIDNERNEILSKIENISKEKKASELKLKEFDDNINKQLEEFRIKESRKKFLIETEKEKEGYGKAVKTLLIDCEKNDVLGKGVCGTLASLISVPKEYETAIEMCLGASLQNIVTQKEEDAKKLVEYLKKNALGRASFLPISAVKGKRLDVNVKKYSGAIGMASDLVEFDKKYEQIILNLLGRTLIVDNMDTAITISKQNAYSFKIVTLGGDVVNPSGLISGGSVAQKTTSILGRSREIEKLKDELVDLAKKNEQLKLDKENYLNSVKEILEQNDNLQNLLKEIDITYATEKQKLVSIEENVEKHNLKLKKLREELENVGKQKEEVLTNKESNNSKIISLEKTIEELNLSITEFTNKNKDSQEYINNLNLDITNLKISISSFDESGASIDEFIERIEQDILSSKKMIEDKTVLRINLQNETQTLEQSINAIDEEIKKIEEEVKNSGDKTIELKNKRVDKNKQLDVMEIQITQNYKIIEDLKEQIAKMDVRKTKIEGDLEQTINKMWEEYELTPNNAQDLYKRPENITAATKQVNSLKEEIKSLGSINIDAIEEYKNTKERYDFMIEQKVDLENSEAKLRSVIAEMTNIMKEQFSKQFKLINKNFGEVFSELFGGGRAEVKISDEDNILESGIEIEAEPPGKKLQNMMLLSGGEKALTAIALLFAILKLNPAPFCVLDEIEAALDDVNVYRFAAYLKKFAKDIQFLIITHRKGTMEAADTVYGITMQENGISKLLSMKLKEE